MTKDIKILAPLVEYSIKNSLSREVFFYSWLKSQQPSGVFKNIKSEKKLFAKQLGISENTVRKYLGTLKKNGFLRYNARGYMILKSSYKMVNNLGISYYRVKHRRNPMVSITCSLKDSKLHFLAFVLRDKRSKQISSIKNYALDKFHSKTTKELVKKNRFDTEDVAVLLDENGLRLEDLNRRVGISRMGIASYINCKTATTGSRWVRRLISSGMLVGEVSRVIDMYKGGYDVLSMLRKIDENGVYFIKGMHIYKKLTNLILFDDKDLNSVTWTKEVDTSI